MIKMNKLQHWQNSFHNSIQSNNLPLISLFRQWISIQSRLISLYRALLESERLSYGQHCVINIIYRAKWFCALFHLILHSYFCLEVQLLISNSTFHWTVHLQIHAKYSLSFHLQPCFKLYHWLFEMKHQCSTNSTWQQSTQLFITFSRMKACLMAFQWCSVVILLKHYLWSAMMYELIRLWHVCNKPHGGRI